MHTGNVNIRTPDEDPLGYDLDWRWQMAKALVDLESTGEKAPLAADADVRKLVRHLMLRRRVGAICKPDAIDRVIGWHESDARALIEAYLIGAVTCEEAALELDIAAADLRLYSCLFFDLRDDAGSIRPAIIMRLSAEIQAIEVPDIAARLRKVALTGGTHGLRRFLCAGQTRKSVGEPSLDELVEAELKRRLVAGELRTGDLTRLQANAIARERMLKETDAGKGPQLIESLKVVQYVLGLTAPAMVRPDHNQDRVDAENNEIQARFAAHKGIGAVTVEDDPVKGVAALNRMIGDTFKKDAGSE